MKDFTRVLVTAIAKAPIFIRLIISQGIAFSFDKATSRNRKVLGLDIEEKVKNFPLYQVSNEEFFEVKNRILQTLRGQHGTVNSVVTISANNMNALRSKFYPTRLSKRTVTSFRPPEYYVIEDNFILERSIKVPEPNKYGYSDITVRVNFFEKDGVLFEKRYILESFNQRFEENESTSISIVPLENSRLLLYLLKPAIESSQILPCVQRICGLSIQDETLRIEFRS